LDKALEILPKLVIQEVKDVRDKKAILAPIRTSVMSKQYGNEEFLAKLIVQACSKL